MRHIPRIAPICAVLAAALGVPAQAAERVYFQAGGVEIVEKTLVQGDQIFLFYPFGDILAVPAAWVNRTEEFLAPPPPPAMKVQYATLDDLPFPVAYRELIESVAAEEGVSPVLVACVIKAESNFNPKALSPVGAQGLMQLMPGTARRFGVRNAFNPEENLRGGVKYLAWLLNRFGNDLSLALAGYNAGEEAVDRYGGKIPPYKETQGYVEKIVGFLKQANALPQISPELAALVDLASGKRKR